MESIFDWDLLLITTDDLQISGVLSLGGTKSVFFVTILSEQWMMLFLASTVIVAVKQWFTGQIIRKRKFLVMKFILCLPLSHTSHTWTHTHPSQKFTTVRLDMGWELWLWTILQWTFFKCPSHFVGVFQNSIKLPITFKSSFFTDLKI